jgi:hypothetical protein
MNNCLLIEICCVLLCALLCGVAQIASSVWVSSFVIIKFPVSLIGAWFVSVTVSPLWMCDVFVLDWTILKSSTILSLEKCYVMCTVNLLSYV